MEYLDQYKFDLEYHPGKVNVMTNALSRKTRSSSSYLVVYEWVTLRVLYEFGLESIREKGQSLLFTLVAQPYIIMRIIEVQQSDDESIGYRARALCEGSTKAWSIGGDNGL